MTSLELQLQGCYYYPDNNNAAAETGLFLTLYTLYLEITAQFTALGRYLVVSTVTTNTM